MDSSFGGIFLQNVVTNWWGTSMISLWLKLISLITKHFIFRIIDWMYKRTETITPEFLQSERLKKQEGSTSGSAHVQITMHVFVFVKSLCILMLCSFTF